MSRTDYIIHKHTQKHTHIYIVLAPQNIHSLQHLKEDISAKGNYTIDIFIHEILLHSNTFLFEELATIAEIPVKGLSFLLKCVLLSTIKSEIHSVFLFLRVQAQTKLLFDLNFSYCLTFLQKHFKGQEKDVWPHNPPFHLTKLKRCIVSMERKKICGKTVN